MGTDDAAALWQSKFHKVIEKKDHSLTILSAAEDGVDIGHGKQLTPLLEQYPKSVSIFAETVNLHDPDPKTGINFGSRDTSTVTLSTSRLVTTTGTAVVSVRGRDGTPNESAGSDARDATKGQAGGTLNVFVANAHSEVVPIKFDARGGHGATTREIEYAAGKGGKGGTASVLVVSAWSSILTTLNGMLAKVKSTSSTAPRLPWDPQPPVEPSTDEGTLPEDHEIFSEVTGVLGVIELLVPGDDPLGKEVVAQLSGILQLGDRRTEHAVAMGLGKVTFTIEEALRMQSSRLGYSVTAKGGNGGSPARDKGQTGIRGETGSDGVAQHTCARTIPLSKPPTFAPLHPLQCRMLLEKADALFYFGDTASLKAASKVLSRLILKIASVLGPETKDDSKSASISGQTETRMQALKRVYEAQRDLIGIPNSMTDPVQELWDISLQAMGLLKKLLASSLDYYSHERNWAPRLSAQTLSTETEKAVGSLEKAENLYLKLAGQKEHQETREHLRNMTLGQLNAGEDATQDELKELGSNLSDLRDRVNSATLKTELQRRSDWLALQLQALRDGTNSSVFDLSQSRLLKSVGNIAKSVEVKDLFKKAGDFDPPKKPSKPAMPGGGNDDTTSKPGEGGDTTTPNPDQSSGGGEGSTTNPDPDPDQPSTSRGRSHSVIAAINVVPKEDGKDKPKGEEDKPKDDKDKDKPKEKRGLLGYEFDVTGFTGKILGSSLKEGTSLLWDGLTTIQGEDGEQIDKSLIVGKIERVAGDLNKLVETNNANVTLDPETGAYTVAEKQHSLLVASQEQIEKLTKQLVNAKIGPQAAKTQKALQAYMDLSAERNHAKVQYNTGLVRLVQLRAKLKELETRGKNARRDAIIDPDAKQLDQFVQLSDDIYKATRVRTMRLLSMYRRGIYLSKLVEPAMTNKGDNISDAALSMPAMMLRSMQEALSDELLNLQGAAGSDASRFPPNFDENRGKYVYLSAGQLDMLKENDYVRITLPPPSPTHAELPEFEGRADVRAYRVRFWLDGLRLKKGVDKRNEGKIVTFSLTHEGDSVYFDPKGNPHIFTHDPIEAGWSYRLFEKPNVNNHLWEPLDSGDIVNFKSTRPEENTQYAAPSPFATWTVSLRFLKKEWLDLDFVDQARLEFFGTSRGFSITSGS